MLDVARGRRNTLTKKKEKRKMRKCQQQCFLLLLFYAEKLIFCQKACLENNLTYIATFVLQFFRVTVYWNKSKICT